MLGEVFAVTFRQGGPPAYAFLLFWMAGTVFIWWQSSRYKVVHVDRDFLYVSNYLKEIVIPLSEISNVTESRFINAHPVTIHLSSPSEFGNKIVFMPTVRMFSMFSSHPVVAEIKRLARLSGARSELLR